MHQILATVHAVCAALKDARDSDPMFLSPAEKAAALVDLGRLEAQVLELRLRVLAEASDLAESTGERDAAAWLAPHLRAEYVAVRADLELARSLRRFPILSTALAEGSVTRAHATVATRSLDALPAVSPDTLARAEAALVDEATRLTPKQLRRVGRHLLAVIDPAAADEAEGLALLAEEHAADRATRLVMKPVGDGTTRVAGLIPDHAAAHLRTCLEAFTQPRVAALAADGRRLPAPRLNGLAVCDLVHAIDPAVLPDHGGDTTALVVTVSLDALRADLTAATLGGVDGDERISAATARQLACTARIIPAVLGSDSEVLDLGRSGRLFSKAQRKALRSRHSTCQAADCTVPSVWTDAHHLDPWSRGGRTDMSNAVLLCRHHHQRAHDLRYTTTYATTGVTFHRRT